MFPSTELAVTCLDTHFALAQWAECGLKAQTCFCLCTDTDLGQMAHRCVFDPLNDLALGYLSEAGFWVRK